MRPPAGEFVLKLRIPAWCDAPALRINGRPCDAKLIAGDYASVRRTWKKGDKVELDLPMKARLVVGDHKNQDKAAVLYGPLVLAADEALADRRDISAGTGRSRQFRVGDHSGAAPERLKTWPSARSSSSMGRIARRPPRHCDWRRSPTRGSPERATRCGCR